MSTVVRISPIHRIGWSRVVVDAQHADRLHRYFCALGGLSVTSLHDADAPTYCVDLDRHGKMQVTTDRLDKSFEISATAPALMPVLKSWIRDVDR